MFKALLLVGAILGIKLYQWLTTTAIGILFSLAALAAISYTVYTTLIK